MSEHGPTTNTDDDERVLTIRVESTGSFFERGAAAIEAGERANGDVDEQRETGAGLSLPDDATLQRLVSPKNLELLRTIREHEPGSIRELARMVDRDVSRVHDNVTELARLNVIRLEPDGQARRPIVEFDRLEIDVSMRSDDDGSASARA